MDRYAEAQLELGRIAAEIGIDAAEIAAQREFLARIGCGLLRGFYFSRPLPAAQLEDGLLQRGR